MTTHCGSGLSQKVFIQQLNGLALGAAARASVLVLCVGRSMSGAGSIMLYNADSTIPPSHQDAGSERPSTCSAALGFTGMKY